MVRYVEYGYLLDVRVLRKTRKNVAMAITLAMPVIYFLLFLASFLLTQRARVNRRNSPAKSARAFFVFVAYSQQLLLLFCGTVAAFKVAVGMFGGYLVLAIQITLGLAALIAIMFRIRGRVTQMAFMKDYFVYSMTLSVAIALVAISSLVIYGPYPDNVLQNDPHGWLVRPRVSGIEPR